MSLSEARTKGKQLLASTLLNHERVTFQEAYDLFCKCLSEEFLNHMNHL